MEYNAKEQSVEIAIQLFAHDLENVLSRRSGKRVRLDKTPTAPQLTLAYLTEAVNLKSRDGRLTTFSWVGMEAQADAVWIYIEAKMPEGLEGAALRNRIFFDLLNDQVNLVHLKFDGKKADLAFKRGDDFKTVSASQ
jgi:DNA-binding sugar fermentation-stimulating protein